MKLRIRSTLPILVALAVPSTRAAIAGPAAVLTRPGVTGSESILVLPTPHADLPAPELLGVSGLPPTAAPHGLAFADPDTVLVADVFNYRLLVVKVSERQLIATIPIGDINEAGPANGTGTVAVDPTGRYALVLGNHTCTGTGFLTVVHAPFHAGSAVTHAPLPWGCGIPRWQTQGIVFDRTGRAYLWTQLSIRVFDPPYVAEAFNLDMVTNSGGAIAITPDGDQLLTTDLTTSGQVSIWSLPLVPTSQPVLLDIAPGQKLDAIGVSPDGTRALAAASDLPQIYSIAAPFTSSSAVEPIPLPSDFSGRGFEDIAFRPDGGLAIATGNGFPDEPQPLLILEPPYTAAGAVAHAVALPGSEGRDEGAVRFWPGLFADGFESGDTSAWSAP